ncbi:MAG: cysteine hydrolase [Acidimicrobiaceae bacterium]|nr:cysteine hydrolase [Acidimicrobiaceae bacterium]MBO0747115.1 cysteine hydrolase [Acidimicrobiaceae bacterium]
MPSFSLSKTAKRALFAGGVAIASFSGTAFAAGLGGGSVATGASGVRAAAPAANSDSARLPQPVPVTVDPATTAYLVLDETSVICAPKPACVATLPASASLLAKARAAGALVVYSETPSAGSQVLPQVAPLPTDPIVVSRADKFFNTDLDQVLSSHGIKTLVLVGTATNGAILYTTFEANVRGYTVVVAEDGTSASTPYIQRYSLFQLLNEPGFANAANTPLQAGAVTLSNTTLVNFQ